MKAAFILVQIVASLIALQAIMFVILYARDAFRKWRLDRRMLKKYGYRD